MATILSTKHKYFKVQTTYHMQGRALVLQRTAANQSKGRPITDNIYDVHMVRGPHCLASKCERMEGYQPIWSFSMHTWLWLEYHVGW